jgi:glyoxylase-like metal-dependent hydrolase (beta-lactamase superfamily II)
VNGPYIFTGDGHIQNWPKVIDQALRLEIDRVVPGHGPAGGAEILRGHRDFLIELFALAGQPAATRTVRFSREVLPWVGTPRRTREQLDDAEWEIRNGKPRGAADPKTRH